MNIELTKIDMIQNELMQNRWETLIKDTISHIKDVVKGLPDQILICSGDRFKDTIWSYILGEHHFLAKLEVKALFVREDRLFCILDSYFVDYTKENVLRAIKEKDNVVGIYCLEYSKSDDYLLVQTVYNINQHYQQYIK